VFTLPLHFLLVIHQRHAPLPGICVIVRPLALRPRALRPAPIWSRLPVIRAVTRVLAALKAARLTTAWGLALPRPGPALVGLGLGLVGVLAVLVLGRRVDVGVPIRDSRVFRRLRVQGFGGRRLAEEAVVADQFLVDF
jgi:hypothetical protein